jgi:peptide/nickel transport system permease protein
MRVWMILSRVLWLVPVIIGVTLMTFIISHIVPADPVSFILGEKARPEQIEEMRRQLGLDRPLPVQYMDYLGGLLRGDLGHSMQSRRDITLDLAQYLPATLELTLAAMLLLVLIGVPLGVVSAVRQDSMLDHVSRVVSMLGVSMPPFWLGLLLQVVFYGRLDILPVCGRLDDLVIPPPRITGLYTADALIAGQFEVFLDALRHLILPSVTLCFAALGVVTRQVRSAMLEVLRQPYITTAHAKGLRYRTVIMRHALRNALTPVITVLALQTGFLLGGAVLTETVFAWPGMGSWALRSVLGVDYQPIMSIALVVAIGYTLVNLLADILYVLIDPRIKA